MDRKMQLALNNLTRLHHSLKQKSDKSDKYTQTELNLPALLRLPRKNLAKIFIFLDQNVDLLPLSMTCKFINHFLSGFYMRSLFYRQLLVINKPKEENIQSELEQKQADLFSNISKEEVLQKYSKACRLHVLFTNAIQKSGEKSKELVQNINKLNDELRIQRQINSKTLTKKHTRIVESKEIAKDNEKLLNSLNEAKRDHLEVVKKITEQIRKIESEKSKARSHARVLQYALEDERADHKTYTTRLRLLKENLFKLKNYCNEMLEPKISKILSIS
jgi:vacuolar-type H+-ATPase subunit I/STV1